MTTPQDKLSAINDLVQEVCGHRQRLEKLVQEFRERIGELETRNDPNSLGQSGSYWRLVAFVDSLIRLRLFLEHNFNYIETMGVLSVARYIFELTVWLKLLEKDSQYGLVYYRELLEGQRDFYKRLRDNAEREVIFLRQTEAMERNLQEKRLAEVLQMPDDESRTQALHRLINEITEQVDQEAARKFSVYAEEAQTNGYGFQAHLVETKVLPKHAIAITDLEEKLKNFDGVANSQIKALTPRRWNWEQQADRVGMKDEYGFIYRYTSMLMHATPASLTTNQKNLEPDEMMVFLKYIRVRLLDAIDMAEKLLASESGNSS